MNCPHCNTELPPQARFCMNCGQPVTAYRADRPHSAAPLVGERKVLTALFADVVGSTTLAEQMDAEDWTTIMNGAFEALSEPVQHYEGIIVRLLGDAMLALFGAPVAHEDDPARAVQAALEMLEAARTYAHVVERDYGIPFAVRIGINTGPVVVGAIGSDLKTEYTAMGDSVNLAARMQSAARPMTALISEHTYRFVAPLIECADLGPLEVKGKAEPVRVYEVLGLRARPARSRGLAGLESPMVGRDAQLAALRSLERRAAAGPLRMAVIIGEPGLGKSRLINEWRSAAAREDLHPPAWLQAQCLSYGQGLAYHLIVDLLRHAIGVTESAPAAEASTALSAYLDSLLGQEASEVFPYLAHLLSIPLTGEASQHVQALDPQALQGHYVAALHRIIDSLARRGPLVLELEDIHWADPSSVDLIIRLIDLIQPLPILICCLTRPDRDAPGWRLVEAARTRPSDHRTEILLSALSEADSRQLVANLLAVDALPEPVREAILTKAEGNPFFVEEVLRMLIDRGAIRQQEGRWVADQSIGSLDIPDTLQGLLLARIDRLPEEVKHTLRVASVIGRQFPTAVLRQILTERAS